MHIDDWLDSGVSDSLPIIKEFFIRYRKPEYNKFKDGDNIWLQNNPIFCTYQNKRYRCTGCSRLGDIWLTSNYNQSVGYSLRVDFSDCSNWQNISLKRSKKYTSTSAFLRSEPLL
jgi:hypothetical protein